MSNQNGSISNQMPQGFVGKIFSALFDGLMFVIILAFTAIAMIAVAIAAPLAIGITALIGRRKDSRRQGWQAARISRQAG